MENSAPYTPEQNGKAERENRTIMESARTMIGHKNLSKALWAEAVNTAAYVLNRTPQSKNPKQTPFEIWHGKKPDLSHIRVFGSVAYVHVPHQMRRKLDAKAKRMLLVGYENDSINYRLFDPNKRSVTISRHVTFNEQDEEKDPSANCSDDELVKLPKIEGMTDKNRNVEDDSDREDDESGDNEEKETEPADDRRSTLRNRASIKPPKRYEVNATEYTPLTFREAISGSKSEQWRRAIHEELKAHDRNNTWSIVPVDQSKKLLDTKWVFKILKDENGHIKRYKARLVARGFQQKEGLDYTETFAPVVRYDSLRVFLAMTTQLNLELIQFDVKTAFLHGDVKEELYLKIPAD